MRASWAFLLALSLVPQDKGLRKLEWKLPPGHAAEFAFLDAAGRPQGDQKFLVLSSELTPQSNRIRIDTYDELPLPFLFQLPPEAFKTAVGWEYGAVLFNDAFDAQGGFESMIGGGSIRPVGVKGRYLLKTVKKGDEETAHIEGAFSLFEIKREFVNNQTRWTITNHDMGSLATSVQFSVTRGMILRAGWYLKAKAQAREGGRIVEKKLETHSQVEFATDLALEAEKLGASRTAAIGRAVDWLKKQQKNGVWLPARPTPAGGDTIHLTALVLRALAAAGVKPDDPARAAASKALRGPAPAENAALSEAILALSADAPTKEEADQARLLGDELLRRREARTSGWGAGAGRNDAPNLTQTALALQALLAIPDAKVPEDVLRSGLEIFTTTWAEEEGSVDLDLVFAPGATTMAAEPAKNVVPCAWPAQLGRIGAFDPRGNRKGSAFAVAAALQSLLAIPARLKLDEKQIQAVDLSLRKGLANLQRNWTFRTVPPVEAAWCSQRMEYLGVLGPLLSRARIEQIGGSDWRLEGTLVVLREQGEDGSWESGTDLAVAKTAHALLFLASASR